MAPPKTSKAANEPETQVKAEGQIPMKPELVEEIAAAKAAQEHRKRALAPDGVSVTAPGAMDDTKELIAHYRRIGAIPEGTHAFIGSNKPADRRTLVAKGYVPVVDPVTNTQPHHEGDPIFYIDDAIYQAHLYAASHISDERLNKADAQVVEEDEATTLKKERVKVTKEGGDSAMKQLG